MKFSTWHNDPEWWRFNINGVYADFDFDNSIVKYDEDNTTNTYMGRNGVIVLAQEKIDISGMTFHGPFHSLGHFLEAPDKWCNKPYFGVKKNSPTWWRREGKATLIHMAILEAVGYKFDEWQWNQILGTLVWYRGDQFTVPSENEIRAMKKTIRDEMTSWTKERIFSEWKRKNALIRRMPKEPYVKMRWGMMGAVAA